MLMRRMFDSWRYYTFGPEQYRELMGNLFVHNLLSLYKVNVVIAIVVGVFSFYPIFIEKDILKVCIYIGVVVIALLLAAYSNYRMQVALKSTRFIYVLVTLFYANIMFFGIYLNVWASPDKLATIFLCLLICVLLMFIIPPFFNLCLTLGAMVIFVVSTIIAKDSSLAFLDIINVLVAGVISLYFNWHISRLRMGLEISANILEDERDEYFDQSTIDELTQLKNRRDFMQTFQRYVASSRPSDKYLCVAICDIDFFKNYNDHYGHPMGDECLRSIGEVLNTLMESMGVYAARVGGEEFALLWFEKDAFHVDTVVSHITGIIGGLAIPHKKSKVSADVTLSIGIYVEPCGSSITTKALYDLADRALYTAKESGRNCAIVTGNDIKEYKITPSF
jgi:diguanylate cyclase (GGDEF)-like protein